MPQVMLEEAGQQLAHLIDQANSGEEIIIISGSVPIARIVPVAADAQIAPVIIEGEPKPKRSGYGNAKDIIIYMADDFDAPLEDFKDYM